jgi:hypothetical protein
MCCRVGHSQNQLAAPKACINDLAAVLEINVREVNVRQTWAACQQQQEAFVNENAAMIEIDVLKTLAACARCPQGLVENEVATRTVNVLQRFW